MKPLHKWVLTLGLAGAVPGVAWAGPFSKPKPAAPAAAPSTARPSNQETANNVAKALKAAKLSGQKIKVQCENGVVVLTGTVESKDQWVTASKAASRVPGVRGVENRLTAKPAAGDRGPAVARGPASPARRPAAPARRPAIEQVNYEAEGAEISQAQFEDAPAAGDNQAVANRIEAALQQAQFEGYDIGISYENGVASLDGFVSHPAHRAAATQIVSQVPGVQQVNNQLEVQAAPAGPGPGGEQYAMGPKHHPAYQGPPPNYGGQMYGPPQGGGMPSNMVYDQPNLPEHAWPAYASYPNYAGVTYPQQYSASAWPYIGPFYPYPQVPLGWRKVQLEWDDGYWQLNFRPRTERWWWFLDYRNW